MSELVGNCPVCTNVVVRWAVVDTGKKGKYTYEMRCWSCKSKLKVVVWGEISISAEGAEDLKK